MLPATWLRKRRRSLRRDVDGLSRAEVSEFVGTTCRSSHSVRRFFWSAPEVGRPDSRPGSDLGQMFARNSLCQQNRAKQSRLEPLRPPISWNFHSGIRRFAWQAGPDVSLPLYYFSLNFSHAGACAKAVRSRSVGSETGGRRWSALAGRFTAGHERFTQKNAEG